MELSIIILTYRKPDFLSSQLSSLRNQLRPGDEIVVTEDGRDEATARAIVQQQEHLPIRHVRHDDDGRRLCLARNRGILASRNPLLLFLDHDVILQPGSIERMRHTIKTGWALGLRRVMLDQGTTNKIVQDGIHLRPFFWSAIRWRSALQRWQGARFMFPLRRRDCSGSSNTWKGCASFGFMCFRDDVVAVNGFDTRYDGVAYAEDWDLFARLEHVGISFGHPDRHCTVAHLEHGHATHRTDSRNYRLLEATIASRQTWAEHGLSKMEESPPADEGSVDSPDPPS